MQIVVHPMAAADREALIRFLSVDPRLNLYLLGLLKHTERPSHAAFWVARRGRAVVGALMRTGTAWLPGLPLPLWVPALSHIDCAPYFAQLMEGYPDSHIVSGPPSIAEEMVERLPSRLFEEASYHSFDVLSEPPAPIPPGLEVRRATLKDLDRVAELHAEGGAGRADWVRRFESIPRRLWYGQNAAGEVIVSCHTHVETENHAMVGGVFVRSDARRQGWATACVSALCAELVAEGKTACLYHDGPGCDGLYGKVGFRPHARWFLSRIAPST